MKNHKKIMRKMLMELRSSLDSKEIMEKSRTIINKLCDLKEFKASKMIMCYMNFKNEVVTGDFIRECLSMGKRVAVPAIICSNEGQKELIASEIFCIESDLTIGRYGILEPSIDKMREIDPSEIDMAIIPGLVFDIRRNRIGYGAGYYDRFLKKLSLSCFKVGIAFEVQVTDEVPVDRYDVPLNMIITENAII